MARSLPPGRSPAIRACLKLTSPEFLSLATCATARLSVSPLALAKAPWSFNSCINTWPKSNDVRCQESPSRMTELLTTPPEQLVEQLRKIAVFSDLPDRKSTRLNSSHPSISYAVFCLKKKKI